MRLIAGAVDWSGDSAVTSIAAMLERPAVWRRRARGPIAKQGPAAVGAIDFDPDAAPQGGVAAGQDLLVAVDARFDESTSLRSRLHLSDLATDGDLVAAAYRQWGTSFPQYLQGEFSIIVWDGRERRLVATRDRLGVRPLYLARGSTFLFAASDVEQLLATGRVSATPNDRVVVGYLRWSFPDPESTFFCDIRRLRPGHVLVATEREASEVDYRRLSSQQLEFSSQEECWAEYRRLFFQAVRRRMTSPAPVVIQLSGGVDSTAITCAADEILRAGSGVCSGAVAASALHPGLSCDEGPFIRDVAAAVSFPAETWDGTKADARELDQAMASAPGGRFFMTGGTEGDVDIANRLQARVILSGMGGDQLNIPDGVIEDALVEGRWRQAAAFLTRAPGTVRWRARIALRVAKALAPRWLREAHSSRISPERAPDWLSPWAADLLINTSSGDARSLWRTHVQRRRWSSLMDPRTLLVTERIHQHSYRTGIEVRLPFLDWDLTTFVLAIPSTYLPPPWPQERLHREALGALLPERVRRRRTKADFSSALAHRVRIQKDTIRGLFEASDWRMGRYVEQERARANLARFEKMTEPRFDVTWSVWAPACVEAWLRASSGYTSPDREAY